MEKKKKFLTLIIIFVALLVILGIIYIYFNNKKKDANSNVNNTEKEITCKYSESELQTMGLNYFTAINGNTAANGEDYVAGSDILNDSKILINISHLQTDHSTTDARYTIDCTTGIGTDDNNNTINFVK